MSPSSYIGITGFMSWPEVAAVTNVLPSGSRQLVMVGVLVSNKSLHSEASNSKRYPDRGRVASIFPRTSNRLNLVHFNTGDPANLLKDLLLARDLAGEHCHGFQLNMAWPDPQAIEDYKAYHPRDTIVLQCGGRALDVADNEPEKLAYKAQCYNGIVNYILIDKSGGEGRELDPELICRYLGTLKAMLPNVGLAFAGGLHAGNIDDKAGPVLRQFPSASIDAEGRLRDKDDNLHVEAARTYLARAAHMRESITAFA